MNIFSYIVWDPSPEVFFLGSWEMRWYGLLFALSFLFSQQILLYIFRNEGKPGKDAEFLTYFLVVATILGARLGHVFFYEPGKYLSNPVEILKIWEGGLASHGAAIGILIAIYLYANYLFRIRFSKFGVKKRKRPGQNYMWVADRLVIVVAFSGALIRLGNFINSEIVGVESNSDYGVVFARDTEEVLQASAFEMVEKVEASKISASSAPTGFNYPLQLEITFFEGVPEATVRNIIEEVHHPLFSKNPLIKKDLFIPDGEFNYQLIMDGGVVKALIPAEGIPRHPAQLYESISSFLIFLFLFSFWNKRENDLPPGRLFGLFLILLFGLRFIYEFFKENQVDFEDELLLNMGQILSLPLVFAGFIILTNSLKKTEQMKTNRNF